jgi:N-acetylmuramoyl-L-alanine amidase
VHVHDHRLALDPEDRVDLTHLIERGAPITPEVIVIHYAVTHSLDMTIAAQQARGYWAHLSIDGYADGGAQYRVTQAIPLNERGSHAGASSWRGRSGVNAFSIGIEIANPGPLIATSDGRLKTVYGKDWPADQAVQARHKALPAGHPWQHWAAYTDQEIDLCVGICHALRAAYPTIVDVVGHDDIAPGRKFDPGAAFPMDWLRAKIFG